MNTNILTNDLTTEVMEDTRDARSRLVAYVVVWDDMKTVAAVAHNSQDNEEFRQSAREAFLSMGVRKWSQAFTALNGMFIAVEDFKIAFNEQIAWAKITETVSPDLPVDNPYWMAGQIKGGFHLVHHACLLIATSLEMDFPGQLAHELAHMKKPD